MHKRILAYGKDCKKKKNLMPSTNSCAPDPAVFVGFPDRLPDCVYFSTFNTSEDVSNSIDVKIENFIKTLL